MLNLDQQFQKLANVTVLCVGDVMLDEYLYGDVGRISPEAPTPVIDVQRQDLMPGGASNVARNLVALGPACILIGVVGEDEPGRQLVQALAKEARIECHLAIDRTRPTT